MLLFFLHKPPIHYTKLYDITLLEFLCTWKLQLTHFERNLSNWGKEQAGDWREGELTNTIAFAVLLHTD